MEIKKVLPYELFFSRTSDFLDVFLTSQCGKSEKTKEAYRDALIVLRRYISTKGKDILTFKYSDCSYEFLLGFKEYMASELNYATASINHRLAAIKSYAKYSYCCDASLMQTYISINAVPFSSVPKVQRDILDEDSIANLLNQPAATKRGLRDTLIMSLLFDAAIRLDELVTLMVRDIYKKDGFTYILIHGKGNKERKVSLDSRTVVLLDKYLEKYHPGKPGAENHLIYTVIKGEARPMSHRNIQKLIKKYALQAGIECEGTSIHPHLLRRSRASGMYQNGTPIEIVSRFLGHSSVETTKDHYAFPSLEQMRKAMEAGRNEDEAEAPEWIGHDDELARFCGLR